MKRKLKDEGNIIFTKPKRKRQTSTKWKCQFSLINNIPSIIWVAIIYDNHQVVECFPPKYRKKISFQTSKLCSQHPPSLHFPFRKLLCYHTLWFTRINQVRWVCLLYIPLTDEKVLWRHLKLQKVSIVPIICLSSFETYSIGHLCLL